MNRQQPVEWRVEEIGPGYAVQFLSRGEHRDEDQWVSIGRYDEANKCVVFWRDHAESIRAGLDSNLVAVDRAALVQVREAGHLLVLLTDSWLAKSGLVAESQARLSDALEGLNEVRP